MYGGILVLISVSSPVHGVWRIVDASMDMIHLC